MIMPVARQIGQCRHAQARARAKNQYRARRVCVTPAHRHPLAGRHVHYAQRHGGVIIHQPEPVQAKALRQVPGIELPAVVGQGNNVTGNLGGNGHTGFADSHRPYVLQVRRNGLPGPQKKLLLASRRTRVACH